MSLHITGKCLGVTSEERGKPGQKFTVTTIHLLDGVHTSRVEVGRDYSDPLPAEGETVGLDVYVFPWSSAAGNMGVQIKAFRRNDDLLGALVAAGK